jgi:peroxiredoxin
MQARNVDASGAAGRAYPSTRKERRAAGREAVKSHQNRGGHAGTMPLIVFAVIAVVALALFGYALIRNQSTPTASQPKALVESASLDPSPSLLSVGTIAPDFRLHDIVGQTYTLQEQRGHPVLLEFFALWCPMCHREAPIIHKLTSVYGDQGVTVMAILASPYGQNYEASGGKDVRVADRTDFVWYGQTYNTNYPLLIDPHFVTVNHYGAASYPTIYLIDAKGKIRYAHSGVEPYGTLAGPLNQLVVSATK